MSNVSRKYYFVQFDLIQFIFFLNAEFKFTAPIAVQFDIVIGNFIDNDFFSLGLSIHIILHRTVANFTKTGPNQPAKK